MLKKLFSLILLSVLSAQAHSALIYSDRILFESQLGVSITDDYNKTLYTESFYSDAEMSAVLGETIYNTTGFADLNLVPASGTSSHYCSGCNGSFLLDFTATSVGNASGVYGVGLDVFGDQNVFGTTAFVTFGDNSTANYGIPDASGGEYPFWGITSDLLISTIHFGLIDGGINTSNAVQRMAMDNLTIGAVVPVPAAVWLFATALIGLVGFSKRRKVA